MTLVGLQCVIVVFPGHTRLITIHNLSGKRAYWRKDNDFIGIILMSTYVTLHRGTIHCTDVCLFV